MAKYVPRGYTPGEQAAFRAMSMEQRIRQMQIDQADYWRRLEADPEAYQEFLKRNFRKRAMKRDENGNLVPAHPEEWPPVPTNKLPNAEVSPEDKS